MAKDRLIKKMPNRELLEEFIRGLSGPVTVRFNLARGEFERDRPKPEATQPVLRRKK